MKKITLFLVAALFSALSFAALNPYAYGLSSTLDGTTLTVNYSLNSAATGVSVVILDGAEEVKTVTCDGKTKGSHSVEISTIGLPTNKSLTWKVVVTGNSVANPTLHDESIQFYLPYGMDVDVDPESDYMGNWYVIEATNGGQSKSGYQSNPFGRGLYAFDAALNPKLNSAGTRGFLGGVNAGATEANVNNDYVNFYRVATSGGRVFIGRFRDGASYHPIVEANPADLNAAFTSVVTSGRAVSIDARGSGENLKLVMLGTDYSITEYDLGTAKSIAAPSRTFTKNNLSIVRNDATIAYDNEGGIWFNQNRGTATATCPTIAHLSAVNGFDYNNISDGIAHNNTNNGGIAVSPDGKQLAVVGAGSKNITVYNINNTGGNITLTKAYTFTVSAGNNHTALAWDYAGNLFTANRSDERIRIFAMPYSGTVSTPCASKYAFEVEEIVANVYTLTTNVVGEGTVEGNAGSYVEGATATLTATPAAHYDFVNWTGDVTSTENPLTITVNSDMTITANFQEHTKYTITASAANNTMGYVTGGSTYYAGETVTLKATAKTGYYFTSWSDSNTENPRTFTATEDLTLQANFAKAYPRVYAYDLNVVDNGDSYTFSFKPNTDAISGNLLLYSEDGTSVIQTHAITTAIVAHTTTTITLNKEDLPNPADIPWAIELSGNPIPAFAETFADANYRFAKGHAAVDNSPESEYFGRVYVADRRSTKANSGLYVYNTDLTQLNAEAYKLGMSAAGYSRPAVGADGTVYLTGYTDAESGIFVVDPSDLTTCTQFYNGTRDSDGLFTNGEAELGSSTSGVGVYGEGANTVLYSMMEDGSNAAFASGKQPIVCYQIGQNDGTVLKQWSTAPTWLINYPAKSADKSYNFGNNAFAATENGVWISQNKSNDADRPEIAFIDKNGTIQFMQNLNKSQGAGLAVNADNTVLYLQKAGEILEYTIAWTGNTPALTLANTYPVSLQHITTLSLDYAGNLIACAGTQYGSDTDNNVMKLVAYTLPTNENTCIVPAAKSKVLKLGNRYNVEVALNDNAMGRATGAGEYKEGVTATFIATPNYGYRFLNWTYGGETSTNNPLELIVESDLTITANFEPIQYTISAPTNDENKGIVTGAGTYSYGTEVTLTATPKAGYKLLYWSDRSTENPRTITMTKNEAISAYFVKIYDEEPTFTITKVWENLDAPASTNNGYQAVGWDGKIYLKDRGNDVINVYSDATTSATYASTDSKDDQSIAVDDAGNLVLRSGSTNFYDAPKQVILYKKGETTYKTIDFTLPASGRCDFISASGDLFSAKGGYVYFYCQYQTTVSRLQVKNGGATAGDIVIDAVGAGITGGNSQSHVMVDIFGNLVTHSRTAAINKTINAYTGEATTFTLPNDQKAIALGGCSFELGGKEFWAYNVKGSNICNTEWNLYNMTDKKYLSNEIRYVENNTDKNSAANWLNVQVVDENTAYIYQFCPTVAMAVWKVSLVRNDLANFTITATANNALMGSIVGSGEYYEGGTAMLTANAYPGFRFVNWTKEGVEVSTDATYLFTVTEDVELVANFEVILLDTENNEGILTNLNDQTVDVAVYRSLTGGMYNTLCLPFDVNDLTGTPLEDATVWQYNGATVKGDGTNKEIFLEFEEVDSITAGKPYLVEPAEDIAAPMEFKDVTISVTYENDVAQDAVTMHGILHPTELEKDNESILFLVENNNLAWANVTANMNGMRAYFQVNEPSLQSARTRAYIRREPTVATDMENITTSETEIKKVIYNGTLYIIRGDEVYTIQGTKLK